MSPFLNIFGRRGENAGKDEAPEAIEQQEMIEGVEQLPETIVKEVMVPRTDTVFLPVDADPETTFAALISSGHSRIPVYRDSIDDVIGILYAKDVLAALIRKQEILLPGLLRKPYFVPETKRIDSLLREFKRRRVHIAVVLDEYGATSGIVCMEDIIEEIVGEIQDEYDDEVDGIVSVGPGIWRCDARVRLEDLAERLELVLPIDDFDSLAGYVFDLFGRIPEEDETISTDNASFTVKKMEGHRIITVQVERLVASEPDSSGE